MWPLDEPLSVEKRSGSYLSLTATLVVVLLARRMRSARLSRGRRRNAVLVEEVSFDRKRRFDPTFRD
jgi:hypothetical protein